MLIFLSALFALYAACMFTLVIGMKRIPEFIPAEKLKPKTRFSVVVPFRDEAKNLPLLLQTIEKLNYPSEMFEIIFVDDDSTDNSKKYIEEVIKTTAFSIRIIQNKRTSNSPKKDAISEAIKNSNFEWIVTTDADCNLPKNRLKTFDTFIQKSNSVMVCGPVLYKSNGSFLEDFQQLDGLSLLAVTIGSFGLKNPLLCNGANLAYKKDAFFKVNGFSGNENIASGDDIFLLEKMKKVFPKQVKFIKSKEASVSTKPQENWKSIVNQRIRWASKTSKQKNTVSMILGLLVFLVNFSILTIPFFLIFDIKNWGYFLFLLFFKIMVDYAVVRQTAVIFNKKIAVRKFLLQPIIYSVITTIVVLKSFRGNYSWKGRRFQKQ